MTEPIAQTPLEEAVLCKFYELYHSSGFPRSISVKVTARNNTGGGRYTDLSCNDEVHLEDGYLDLGGRFIEMEGVANGIMAVVRVKESQLKTLEFTVYGGDYWDGAERKWGIV